MDRLIMEPLYLGYNTREIKVVYYGTGYWSRH